MLHEQHLDDLICNKLQLQTKPADLSRWDHLVNEVEHPKGAVTIAMCGKYTDLSDSYKSLNEALRHAGIHNHVRVNIEYVDSETLTSETVSQLAQFDAILVPGGFGKRGVEGKIRAAQFAREAKIPYLGICLGMQVATIEFARNVLKLAGAHSSEFAPQTSHKVFLKLRELKNVEDMGHNMRLGAYSCILKKKSLAYRVYQQEKISERHRHRYEFNPEFEYMLENKGMRISGKNPERNLVEIVELSSHPWFLGCQFHPEFKIPAPAAAPAVRFLHRAREAHQGTHLKRFSADDYGALTNS
jgi:CTP synthase